MTVYDHIESNNRWTIFICAMFPLMMIFFMGVILAAIKVGINAGLLKMNFNNALTLAVFATPFIVIFDVLWIKRCFSKSTEFSLKGLNVKESSLREYPELYRTVQNLSITAGIKTPTVYVMHTYKMNAFAAGTDPDESIVVFTKGLVESLSPSELEAVVAHEIAHIVNRDTRLMMIIIYAAGFFNIISEYAFRSMRMNMVFGIIGAASYLFAALSTPLIRLPISRTREFAADSTAVLLTRNPKALMEALLVVSGSSDVQQLDNFKHSQLCISAPYGSKRTINSIFSTHPSIHDRVKAVAEMSR